MNSLIDPVKFGAHFLRELSEIERLKQRIKVCSMTFDYDAKCDAARANRREVDAYWKLDFSTWIEIKRLHEHRSHALIQEVCVDNDKCALDYPVYRRLMGHDLNKRITKPKQLKALPWPDELLVLAEDDLCPYTEPRSGRRSLHEWLREAFPPTLDQWEQLYDQFSYALHDVLWENADRADKPIINFAMVPSPVAANRLTKAPYSGAEVAEWWKEAMRRVGYKV
jgi:hypothetical protein